MVHTGVAGGVEGVAREEVLRVCCITEVVVLILHDFFLNVVEIWKSNTLVHNDKHRAKEVFQCPCDESIAISKPRIAYLRILLSCFQML